MAQYVEVAFTRAQLRAVGIAMAMLDGMHGAVDGPYMARYEVVKAARAQIEAAMIRAGVEYALGPPLPRPGRRALVDEEGDVEASPPPPYARIGDHGRVLHTRYCDRVEAADQVTPLTYSEALRFAAMLGHRRCPVCDPEIGAARTPAGRA